MKFSNRTSLEIQIFTSTWHFLIFFFKGETSFRPFWFLIFSRGRAFLRPRFISQHKLEHVMYVVYVIPNEQQNGVVHVGEEQRRHNLS